MVTGNTIFINFVQLKSNSLDNMKKFLVIFIFLNIFSNNCFSQNDIKKLEEIINTEIENKTQNLREEVESQIMNPFTKKIYSEFAIDTFKIEYFKRRIILKLNSKEGLELIKNNTLKYEKLLLKYYELSKKECTEIEKKQLVLSQNAWENFKKQEFIWLSKRFKGSPLDNNYYSEYCEIIKQRMLNLFFYYSDLKEN